MTGIFWGLFEKSKKKMTICGSNLTSLRGQVLTMTVNVAEESAGAQLAESTAWVGVNASWSIAASEYVFMLVPLCDAGSSGYICMEWQTYRPVGRSRVLWESAPNQPSLRVVVMLPG